MDNREKGDRHAEDQLDVIFQLDVRHQQASGTEGHDADAFAFKKNLDLPDGPVDPDFVGLIGASVALAASDVPWAGPVAGLRVAQYGSDFKINPTSS